VTNLEIQVFNQEKFEGPELLQICSLIRSENQHAEIQGVDRLLQYLTSHSEKTMGMKIFEVLEMQILGTLLAGF